MKRTVLAVALVCLSFPAWAQPTADAEGERLRSIAWSSFVAAPGQRPRRTELPGEPGQIDMMGSPWRCGFARPRYAQIAADDWSVQRVLACRRGEATVSSTASCRVQSGGQVDERAATLALGTVDQTAHVTVTLSCQRR